MTKLLLPLFLCALPVSAADRCDLAKAGFHDPKSFEKFFVRLQQAAARRDVGAISRMANYPLRIGENQRVDNETELKRKFASVFTPAILRAIAGQSRPGLKCDYRGARIGDGAVWIQEVEGVVVISAINERP